MHAAGVMCAGVVLVPALSASASMLQQGMLGQCQECRALMLPREQGWLCGCSTILLMPCLAPIPSAPPPQDLIAEALEAQEQPGDSSSAPATLSSAGSMSSQGSSELPGGKALHSVENRRHVRPADAARAVRYQRRKLPACRELMYVCDGDRNGVIHYLGTALGTQEWVNPVLAKRVEVRASSPASRWVAWREGCGGCEQLAGVVCSCASASHAPAALCAGTWCMAVMSILGTVAGHLLAAQM